VVFLGDVETDFEVDDVFFLVVAVVAAVAPNRSAPAHRSDKISIQTLFFNRLSSEGQAVGPAHHVEVCYGVVPARKELVHFVGVPPVWLRRAPGVAAVMIWNTTGSPGFSEAQMRVTSSTLITG